MKFIMTKNKYWFIFFLTMSLSVHTQEPPRWLIQRNLVYPPEQYITGAGEGRSLEEAQERAVAQISLFFKTTVRDSRQMLANYNQALSGEVQKTTAFAQNTVIESETDFFGVEFAPSYVLNQRDNVPLRAK
jgi:hypothetical protein